LPRGDCVALLAANSHLALAAHYAVPFAGALVAPDTHVTVADMGCLLQFSTPEARGSSMTANFPPSPNRRRPKLTAEFVSC